MLTRDQMKAYAEAHGGTFKPGRDHMAPYEDAIEWPREKIDAAFGLMAIELKEDNMDDTRLATGWQTSTRKHRCACTEPRDRTKPDQKPAGHLIPAGAKVFVDEQGGVFCEEHGPKR